VEYTLASIDTFTADAILNLEYSTL